MGAYGAIEDIVVSFLAHGELDVRSIARGDVGLCHQEGGAY